MIKGHKTRSRHIRVPGIFLIRRIGGRVSLDVHPRSVLLPIDPKIAQYLLP